MDYKNEENGNNKKRFSKGYDLVHKWLLQLYALLLN